MSRVLRVIDAHAAASPEAIALSTPSATWTYAQLGEAVSRTATALFAFAPLVRPGSPVAVRLPNGPAWVILDLALIRLGWKTDSVPVGVQVEVEGFRAKAGGPVANGRSIKLADGRELFSGGSAPER